MPHIYESVLIFDPTSEAIAKAEIKKFKDMLQKLSTRKKVKAEDMGEKRLAYEMKSHKTGWYCVFTYEANPENIEEIERQCRIDDHVLKFITIKYDDEDYEDPGDKLEDFYPVGEQPDSDAQATDTKQNVDLFDLIFNNHT